MWKYPMAKLSFMYMELWNKADARQNLGMTLKPQNGFYLL